MDHFLLDAFIVYLIGLLLVPNLKVGGRLRRAFEMAYWPLVRLGLWYRWSMYAPEVPEGTQIALIAVVFDDGTSEVVALPGLDDGNGFGKAHGLRFVALQWALGDPLTDYLKPAVCDYALRSWRTGRASASAAERQPAAVEVRVHWYRSPEPGQREGDPTPDVRTVWSQAVRP